MWREIKDRDMQSNQMRFAGAEHAIQTFAELQTTMNVPGGYDYSMAQGSESTGASFGIDEYLVLKAVLQEAATDMPYELWCMLVEHCVRGKSVRSMEDEMPNARRKIAVAKRAVEQCLRRRDMLLAGGR